jgi:hypothetical protein
LGAPYNGVIDDNAVTFGIDVGLGFGEKWAAEVGLNSYGSFDGLATPCPADAVCPPISTDVSGNDQTVYTAALVRRFSIGDFRLFGKAGYYRADLKTNINLPNADFSPDGLVLGLGLRWHFDNPWSVSLEVERFDDNVSQFGVGFGWGLGNFGNDRDTETE